MYLAKSFAVKLYELGFKRAEYHDTYNPYDVYAFKDEEWMLGGRILPAGEILSPEEVCLKGTWLPTALDLMYWLEENDCSYTLECVGGKFNASTTDSKGKKYSAEAGTAETALFYIVVELLKEYKGNPVDKAYEVIDAEYTGKEEV